LYDSYDVFSCVAFLSSSRSWRARSLTLASAFVYTSVVTAPSVFASGAYTPGTNWTACVPRGGKLFSACRRLRRV